MDSSLSTTALRSNPLPKRWGESSGRCFGGGVETSFTAGEWPQLHGYDMVGVARSGNYKSAVVVALVVVVFVVVKLLVVRPVDV